MALLVAVEGIDGSGKGTQVDNVESELRSMGHNVSKWTFPQYETNRFGRQIGRFLNGEFGQLDDVRPELSALLFAGDRLESREALLAAINDHDVVLLDRYVASNIAHQAGRLKGQPRDELTEFLLWLEFDLHKMPRPNRTFWLDLPVSVAQERIAMKAARSYTDKAADLQEADAEHLIAAADVYRTLSTQPGWVRLACESRSAAEIAAEMQSAIRDLL